ncbi:MAG: biotin--[acetyl-CoA-carboxylase] ligase [Chitinophagaceae bacterium]
MPIIGQSFIELPSIDSTNIYAMNQIHAHMAKHGTCYMTHDQTKGKGQRGKNWHSSPYSNIAMSVILEPGGISLHHSFFLSAGVALACLELINNVVGEDCSIKWPNDIYWRDRKAGGILIENVISGNNWNYAVAGIGLNINQTSFPDKMNAVSIKQITGKDWDYVALSRELCNLLEKYWQIFLINPDQILNAYNQQLYKKNESVTFKQENRRFQGIVRKVNNHGDLIVDCPDSHAFSHGSIEWII